MKTKEQIHSKPELKNLNDVAERMQLLHFKRRIIGGLDEEDVWQKIKKLDQYYQKAFDYQKMQYEILLNQAQDRLESKDD